MQSVYMQIFFFFIKIVLQICFFKEYIPVISILCNPGIRERHWVKMSAIAQKDITPDSGTTLRKVLKQELMPFMEEFETISGAASKVM